RSINCQWAIRYIPPDRRTPKRRAHGFPNTTGPLATAGLPSLCGADQPSSPATQVELSEPSFDPLVSSQSRVRSATVSYPQHHPPHDAQKKIRSTESKVPIPTGNGPWFGCSQPDMNHQHYRALLRRRVTSLAGCADASSSPLSSASASVGVRGVPVSAGCDHGGDPLVP